MNELAKRKPKDILFLDNLTIEWQDGSVSRLPFFALRDGCPCAACVDEVTGKKTLDPASIPKDIHIIRAEYVGNYALRIHWSDHHNTGIYTFRMLRQMAELATAAKSNDMVP
ncbi:MAG: DUF971 domain-containing protein [Deltaproteobacteria bacterium]|nr:DUF971 domain-containing protein [Deltaproteobacteria bacterium]